MTALWSGVLRVVELDTFTYSSNCASSGDVLAVDGTDYCGWNGGSLNGVAVTKNQAIDWVSRSSSSSVRKGFKICFADIPCAHTDGLTENVAACDCGTSKCTPSTGGTGLFCFASEHHCSHTKLTACEYTSRDGKNTGGLCICSATRLCNTTTLPYCTAASSVCYELPSCIATDGATLNTVDCQCGDQNTKCTGGPAGSGRYCHATTNTCSQKKISPCEFNFHYCRVFGLHV